MQISITSTEFHMSQLGHHWCQRRPTNRHQFFSKTWPPRSVSTSICVSNLSHGNRQTKCNETLYRCGRCTDRATTTLAYPQFSSSTRNMLLCCQRKTLAHGPSCLNRWPLISVQHCFLSGQLSPLPPMCILTVRLCQSTRPCQQKQIDWVFLTNNTLWDFQHQSISSIFYKEASMCLSFHVLYIFYFEQSNCQFFNKVYSEHFCFCDVHLQLEAFNTIRKQIKDTTKKINRTLLRYLHLYGNNTHQRCLFWKVALDRDRARAAPVLLPWWKIGHWATARNPSPHISGWDPMIRTVEWLIAIVVLKKTLQQ